MDEQQTATETVPVASPELKAQGIAEIPASTSVTEETKTVDAGDKVGSPKADDFGKREFAWAQMRKERDEYKRSSESFKSEMAKRDAEILAYQQYFAGSTENGNQKPLSPREVQYLVHETLNRQRNEEAKENGRQWLLDQKDVQTQQHYDEIMQLMEDEGFSEMLNRKPYQAFEHSYRAWQERRATPATAEVKKQEKLAAGIPQSPSGKGSVLNPANIPIGEYSKMPQAQRDELWKKWAQSGKR